MQPTPSTPPPRACARGPTNGSTMPVGERKRRGAGRKSGIEVMQRVVAGAMEKSPNSALLKLDVSNAFNEVDRDAVLQAVSAKLPELAGLAAAWYGGVTTHGAHLPEGSVQPVLAERGLDLLVGRLLGLVHRLVLALLAQHPRLRHARAEPSASKRRAIAAGEELLVPYGRWAG